MRAHALLAESQFFKELSKDSLRTLSGICSRQELRKGEILFREGEAGRAVYLLRRGAIRLSKTAEDGTEVVIKIIKPGETFAEVVLFEQERYPASATALTYSEVFVFPRAELHRLLDREVFRNDFIRALLKKLRYLADQLFQRSGQNAERRLLSFLVEQGGECPTFRLPMSKKEIAAAIGITPETLSRCLRRLRRRKIVVWSGKTVTWLKPPAANSVDF